MSVGSSFSHSVHAGLSFQKSLHWDLTALYHLIWPLWFTEWPVLLLSGACQTKESLLISYVM